MTNLFEQFQGADLDRLAECLKAIKKAGLSTDKYTQAGVNQSNGNVWVWSEDWAGCVYCSIGFDVSWLWSCPNCGEEYDFETYQEMEDFASEQYEKHDGCKACCEEEAA
ncbi:mqsa mqsa for mqsr toxin [Caudoviricetes sp.]|nr:mqsa mqsa for mqsr toxin [Caudoviricetes sp.]